MFPFPAQQQQTTAAELVESLQQNRPPVVHAVTHSLSINHAVLLFGAVLHRDTISFAMYDPNDPRAPLRDGGFAACGGERPCAVSSRSRIPLLFSDFSLLPSRAVGLLARPC